MAIEADATKPEDCQRVVDQSVERFGRLDILHNNVGVGTGDAGPVHILEEAWDRIISINLKSVLMPCQKALPIMRKQKSGSIVNVSSIAAICSVGIVAYKTSKAGVNALTHSLAIGNAKYGIRVNAIMPGLMNTPMAIENISRSQGVAKEDLIRARDYLVPLGGKMGTAWDVAYAGLYLASDEAKFVTGVMLPVDGGQSSRVG